MDKKFAGAGGGLLLKPCPICGCQVKPIAHFYRFGEGFSYASIECCINLEVCNHEFPSDLPNDDINMTEEKKALIELLDRWAKVAGAYAGCEESNRDIILNMDKPQLIPNYVGGTWTYNLEHMIVQYD
jgi:hypothetical protein